MKICIYGAGAVGGHIAARLAKGGAQVSVIGRGAHLAAMAARGLEIRTDAGNFHVPVNASATPATIGPQDAVVVAVKAPALPAIAAAISPLLGPDTPVVFAMNGIPWWYFHGVGGANEGRRLPLVDPGGVVWSAIGPARAIGCVVYSGCTVVEPGVIAVAGSRSRLVLGEPDGRMTDRVQGIAALLTAGGLPTSATPRIRDTLWAKLVLNLGTGPMGVLTQATSQQIFTDPVVCAALHQISAEVAGIAAAMGCPIDPDPAGQIALARSSPHMASIVQDLLLGRPMEVDAIFRQPLELARLANVPTPTLDLVVALAVARARQAGLYAD